MPPSSPDRVLALLPLRVVIDACVFPQTKRWLVPLIDASKTGYIILIWSPLIIAESNRVLTWLWLKRHGREFSNSTWRQCSTDFKRMFGRLTSVFHVIEDSPPLAEAWIEPSDVWDIPIWTAAKRGSADFIVTENLSDGPPRNEEGFREYDGIVFSHPDEFLGLLTVVADYLEAQDLVQSAEDPKRAEGGSVASLELPLEVRRLLNKVIERKLGTNGK